MGRDSVLRRDCGEVINGGSGDWLGFGEVEAGAGEVAGDDIVDMAVVVVMPSTF